MRLFPTLFLIGLLLQLNTFGQTDIYVHPELLSAQYERATHIAEQLTRLLSDTSDQRSSNPLIHPKNRAFTNSVLGSLSDAMDDASTAPRSLNLIDLYPISSGSSIISVTVTTTDQGQAELVLLMDLMVIENDDQILFSTVLEHRTRYWKHTRIGKIDYRYRSVLNTERANNFAAKNTSIAERLDTDAEDIMMYMCDDYHEIIDIMGIRYDSGSIGKYKNGYGVDAGLIFSIMGNEDFSHDILHHYVEKKVDRRDRNWVTEEGLAYLWGNAYWVDSAGEMIEQDRLEGALRQYLAENPRTTLLNLFDENAKIFFDISEDVSARSTISALILREIEQKHGMEGLWKMLRATHTPNSAAPYLDQVEELIGINRKNFNKRVHKLLMR